MSTVVVVQSNEVASDRSWWQVLRRLGTRKEKSLVWTFFGERFVASGDEDGAGDSDVGVCFVAHFGCEAEEWGGEVVGGCAGYVS